MAIWESSQGIRLHITCERFASLADEHVGAIRYSIAVEERADQRPVTIALRSSTNTARGNYDLMHWETRDQGQQDGLILLLSETKRSNVQLAQTSSFNRASR
jgi:kojibiose phosphorylase